MSRFITRFIGALVLDPSAFEEIEADRRANMQSVLVVLMATAAAGFAAGGLGLVGIAGFVTGAIVMLGGWLVWVSIIATIGTTVLAEPATKSDARELLRTLGFAAAPGVFFAFAAMRPAAPIVLVVVSAWMLAAAVLAVRQALDYRHLPRAAAVCILSWAISMGLLMLIASLLARPVS